MQNKTKNWQDDLTPTQARFRVLVVDDDSLLRIHARYILEKMHFEVHEAHDGSTAIEALRAHSFDTVLLDVRLAGDDGFEICRQIRDLPDCLTLPVILLTGLEEPEISNRAFEAGATDFTAKPLDWRILCQRVRFRAIAHRAATALKATECHQQAVLNPTPDAIIQVNPNGKVAYIKTRRGVAREFLSFIVGGDFLKALPGGIAASVRSALQRLSYGESGQAIGFSLLNEGVKKYFEMRMAIAAAGELMVMLHDVSDCNAPERENCSLAFFDRETGLPNRERVRLELDEKVDRIKGKGVVLAVMRLALLGMDHARGLLGSEGTVELMRIISNRLQEECAQHCLDFSREVALIGRVSEAGFVLVCGDVGSAQEVEKSVQRLLCRVGEVCQVGEYEIRLNAVIGAAVYPQDDTEAAGLLDKAELALEQRQASTSNRISFYHNGMRERSLRRVQLTRDLQIALENQALHVAYQPKVTAADGKLVGMEALVRWERKAGDMVSPAEFIPLAEDSGLILQLGEFVLGEVCKQLQGWQQSGAELVPVAVNFSGHQFSNRGMVKSLLRVLEHYSLASRFIEVELTESVVSDNHALVNDILGELRQYGIRTAIDDFGTGYSSLSSLRKFPFHTLKIDRSFVHDMNHDVSATSIVGSIIEMGHALGMQVVAEGVEDEQQLDLLRNHGCDVIQGYLTGRPVSAEEIGARLLI